MFNNKRIEELENSVRALTALVDMHDEGLYGYKYSSGQRGIALVSQMKMLTDYLGVTFITTRPQISCIKIKKEKK